MENDNIQLWHGDCLELMENIPDKSVDAIICDLPYGTTACKWDTIIPFDRLWEQYNRIIKDNGAICLFGSEPFSSMLRMSNLKMYKYDWVWVKPRGTGHLNVKKQPLRNTETISIFYKNQSIYNPQFEKGEPYSALKAGKKSSVSQKGTTTYGRFMNGAEFRNDNIGIRYPKTTLNFGVVERGTLHPTQKPVALLEYLVKTYSNEGDLILDNTAGSMTTAIAAINTNRRCICIEKDDNYFEIGSERVKKHLVEKHSKLF